MNQQLLESIHMSKLFWTIPEGSFPVRRDDNLIKSLLIEIEADDSPLFICAVHLDAGDEGLRRYYHMKLLEDAGLVEESDQGGVWRLTDAGHTAAGIARENEIWRKARDIATKAVPQYGLGLLVDIANQLVRQKLRDLGMPL